MNRRDFLGILSLLPLGGKVLPALAADIQVEIDPSDFPERPRFGQVTVRVNHAGFQYVWCALFHRNFAAERFRERALKNPYRYCGLFTNDQLMIDGQNILVDDLSFIPLYIVAGT